MSRRTRVAAGAVVSAVLLVALLWFTDPREIWRTLSQADLKWVALAMAVNVATVPVMAWRWSILIRAKGMVAPFWWLVRTYFVALFLGQFLPAVPLWGVPPFSAATQSLDIITRGSLVLDAVSTSLDRVVWRGVSQTDIDYARSESERDAIIRDAAHELVKRIPFKK